MKHHGIMTIASLAALILPTSSVEAQGAAAAEVAAPQATDAVDGSRVTCRTRRRTGTRFTTRICHTVAEWERMSQEHQRAAGEMINRPSSRPAAEDDR